MLDVKTTYCFVLFYNKKNRGDYACCNVNKQYLDVLNLDYIKDDSILKRFKAAEDLTKDRFKPQKFLEYDYVELAVEKEKYAIEGVHKCARGAVMENYCIGSEYYVIFTDESNGEDIAEMSVHENDLILIKR